MKTLKQTGEKGFTLIELLIVIAIIGFLAAAVLVAVDPVKRIQDSRDSRRFSEANAILNAILTKQVDDRRIFDGLATAPIVTSATFSQVIVASDVGIECDVDNTENYPGCNANLNAGADTTATPKGCVANLGGMMAGTVSIDTVNGELDGTGTDFIPQVTNGDVLLLSDGQLCTATTEVTMTDVLVSCQQTLTAGSGLTVINTTRSIVPNYIASLPLDPRGSGQLICDGGNVSCTENADDDGTADVSLVGNVNTGYYIHRTNGNRIEIGACAGEQTTSISVKR